MWGHPAQCWGHRVDIHTSLLNKEVLAVPPDSGVSLASWEPTRRPPAQFSEIPLHGSNLMRWLRPGGPDSGSSLTSSHSHCGFGADHAPRVFSFLIGEMGSKPGLPRAGMRTFGPLKCSAPVHTYP